jgi:hypothetical protein
MSQQPTEKSDVCIFGVVMLELVITKQPIEKGKYIVREVKTAFDASDTVFCRIKGMIDARIMNTDHLGAFSKFVQLALQSASSRWPLNPTVKEIEVMLQSAKGSTALQLDISN